ncbi:MAG: hypothetical protein KatS3mg112_1169 [Thermogutta sp.]|nr:MAG: hypothetical protein KatS3mg112_1169 [Thermogutta sp.]
MPDERVVSPSGEKWNRWPREVHDHLNAVMSRRVVIFQNAPGEPPGQIADFLMWGGVDCEILPLYSHVPKDLDWENLAGLVALGGPMNVDEVDKFPYLAREKEWLTQAVRREIPVLGICLGAQLLARCLNARVYPNPVKEIGWYEVSFTPATASDALFSGVPWRGVVFQWHGDTFTLPEGAFLLATASDCVNQAFRFGTCAWGLQFHLEVTPALVEAWMDSAEASGELAQLGLSKTKILEETRRQFGRMQRLAEVVFPRFARLCALGVAR